VIAMTPTMCVVNNDAIPADVIRQVALSEVLAIRVQVLAERMQLANEYEGGVSEAARDYLVTQLVAHSRRCRERIGSAAKVLDVADADILTTEIELAAEP
jgi:uncharacterized protein (DUF849 family)